MTLSVPLLTGAKTGGHPGLTAATQVLCFVCCSDKPCVFTPWPTALACQADTQAFVAEAYGQLMHCLASKLLPQSCPLPFCLPEASVCK